MIRKVELIMENKREALVDFATKTKEECHDLIQHIVRYRFINGLDKCKKIVNKVALKVFCICVFMFVVGIEKSIYGLITIWSLCMLTSIIILLLANFLMAQAMKDTIYEICIKYMLATDYYIDMYQNTNNTDSTEQNIEQVNDDFRNLKTLYVLMKDSFTTH